MSHDVEKYRRWIRGFGHARSRGIFFLAKGILDKLGEESGTALIVEQIKEMGRNGGERRRQAFEEQGLDNSFKNYTDRASSDDNVYRFAWEGSSVTAEEERIVEYTYCPIAEGFKMLGDEGVEIGELFCENIDDAVIQAYNSGYECVRESSLNLDGLCRLHFKKKQ